jgi:hypothetical protein
MASRTDIFHKYKNYKQERDDRSMDDICEAQDGFQLQVQQKFLKEYITDKADWKALLLYHQIGSGKTCTSITLAETYVDMHPEAKVTVVLPARLRTNFIDELVSPCGLERYISNDNFAKYHDSATSASAKAKIRRNFMDAISTRYEIMSYEKFKMMAHKTGDLQKWVKNFTKNRLIIIDEVHNLLSDKYDEKKYKEISESHTMSRAKGTNTILFKYLNDHADPSCRMIYLTATPVFDNMMQFKELVSIMSPGERIKRGSSITDVIDRLRGKVSFFPGTSPNAYPSVSFTTHDIPLTKVQDKIIRYIIDSQDDDTNENKEAFMIKQRQASVACYPNKIPISKNVVKVAAKMSTFAPKMVEAIANIKAGKGKHVVYSTFIGASLRILEEGLKKEGFISITKANKDPELWKNHEYKVYALWDGSIKDADKLFIKSAVNAKDNIDGRRVRVILGSPSIKEGVSFKHVQHLHLLDPVWNSSAKIQVEGRAIRFCSHIDIPKKHPFLKRHVEVHVYKSVPRPGGEVTVTADQEIYDRIIPAKEKNIKAAEAALKKVAIDYFLFRNMYREQKAPTPKPKPFGLERSNSMISIDEDITLKPPRKIKRKTNTCPKKRRPDKETGLCPPEHILKTNLHGDECCYRERKTKDGKPTKPKKVAEPEFVMDPTQKYTVKGCAKDRRPVDGKCATGFRLKLNKQGSPCCFKIRTAKPKAKTTQ